VGLPELIGMTVTAAIADPAMANSDTARAANAARKITGRERRRVVGA
jgi:hypothetical protein